MLSICVDGGAHSSGAYSAHKSSRRSTKQLIAEVSQNVVYNLREIPSGNRSTLSILTSADVRGNSLFAHIAVSYAISKLASPSPKFGKVPKLIYPVSAQTPCSSIYCGRVKSEWFSFVSDGSSKPRRTTIFTLGRCR